MRPEDTELCETKETDEELFAKARAHMEKYWGAASLDRRLWDATVRIALRGLGARPEGGAREDDGPFFSLARALGHLPPRERGERHITDSELVRQLRNDVIEECAEVCAAFAAQAKEDGAEFTSDGAETCARKIRALKQSTPQRSPE